MSDSRASARTRRHRPRSRAGRGGNGSRCSMRTMTLLTASTALPETTRAYSVILRQLVAAEKRNSYHG